MVNHAKILKEGGIGVYPTDTLYGVVGSAFSKKAVKRIYGVKGRDEKKPFIILISSMNDLAKFGIKLTPSQKSFLAHEWPGPVSAILPCKKKSLEYLHRGSESLAFRMPRPEKLRALIKKTGPLVAPSANPQGEKPAKNVAAAKEYFGESVDFYVAGGTKEGKASRVVSLLAEIPVIVRK